MDNETDVIILSDSPEELLVAGEEKSVSVEPVQVAAEGDGLSRLNQHINPNPISIETGDITEDDAAIDDEEEATSGSDSDEDEAEDSDLSGDADHDTLVAEKTAEKKPLGGLAVGPRRSKRSNFGNRYEQAISKEKEDGKPPLQNGDLLDEGKYGLFQVPIFYAGDAHFVMMQLVEGPQRLTTGWREGRSVFVLTTHNI